MELKILVIQNNAILGNREATINNIDAIIKTQKNKKPDLIVLPEVWSIGWQCKNFTQNAEDINKSESIGYLQSLALEFNATVIGGSIIQKKESSYKNTCPIIAPNGSLIGTYEKLHLFSHTGSEENKYITTGNELKILNLKGTKIGITICYDIRFPEIYRAYSQLGVELFVNVTAWSKTKPEHWEIMHKARAIENQCYMIAANQTGKITNNEYNLGHSFIIDPWGNAVAMLQEEEGFLFAKIDTDEVKKQRENFPLLKDRRDNNFYNYKYKEININE